MSKLLNATTAIAAVFATAAPAFGLQQVAADSTVEVATPDVVVVTARKREERLVDAPTAVTALSPEQIEYLEMTDARDMLQLVPNAYLQENNAGTARDIALRGVSTPTLFAEPGVSMYVDEIYSSGFISHPTQFRDVERIEILRGPQGALYGRNAVGGAVNIVSKRPETDLSASIRATAASHDRYAAEGVVNVPLGSKAGVRVLAWTDDQNEGEYFNPVTGRYLDARSTDGARLTAALHPTHWLSLNAVIQQEDAEGPGTYLYFPGDGETEDTVARDTQPSNEFEATRHAFSAVANTAAGEFTFVAGGRTYDLDGVEDTDLSDDATVDLLTGRLGQQVTTRRNEVDSTHLEGRWLSGWDGPLQLLAGVTVIDESAAGDVLTDLPSVSSALTGGTLPVSLLIENDQSVESMAGFFDASWALNERLEIIGSARYTVDEKSVDFGFTPSAAATALVGPAQSAALSETFENFSPGVTVSYAFSDALNGYAKVQTGFRAGGFNFNVANASNLRYDEETSVNYELGLKRSVSGRGYVAATVFLMTQDDVLVPAFDFTAPPGLQGYLINAGEAETLGLELEASLELTSGLTVQAGLGVLDGEFTGGSIPGAAGPVSLDGLELPAARDLTTSLAVTYRRPLTSEVDLVLNGAHTSRSEGFVDAENTTSIGGNSVLNLSAGVETDRFGLHVFGRNVTDDQYDIAFGGFRPPSSVGLIRAEGAVYGVTLRAGF